MELVPRPSAYERLERAIRGTPGFTLLLAFMGVHWLFNVADWKYAAIVVVGFVSSVILEFAPEIVQAYMNLRVRLGLSPLPQPQVTDRTPSTPSRPSP